VRSTRRRTACRCAALATLGALLLGCAGGAAAGGDSTANGVSPSPSPSAARTTQDRATRPQVTVPPSPAPVAAVPVSAVRQAGDGQLHVVAGSSTPVGTGPLRRYLVEVEGGVGVDPEAFALAAERTLGAPRSWTAGGRWSLQRVDSGAVDFRLVLASPSLTDRLCAPLRTLGRYSCHHDGRAVINAMRWLSGATAYEGRLLDYRHYVVNHEVGHALGHGHVSCPGRGKPSPVMMQQTKGVGACVAQPWPHPAG
jgi:hypothetical protein